ncbi:hypothetical protein CU669_15010 [Paramagnetospirillum kuznetsovii]|uniref:Uncharacterized protein n=1 Tax=Paramagnetospirillum kuznetsovii TaxID=2053833 RepID=A0A364NVF2_9PROT|nr:hypothetical protein [Paramagnetospirillum kuznetsovii]RAU21064.1 hypothetical protein CU669_15010 [Paramagnetospirillum kuznetsovii]
MKIALMLIWIGGFNGGPSVVEFSSLETCQAAAPVVISGFQALSQNMIKAAFSASCVEVTK